MNKTAIKKNTMKLKTEEDIIFKNIKIRYIITESKMIIKISSSLYNGIFLIPSGFAKQNIK